MASQSLTEEPSSVDDIAGQLQEYDSDASDDEDSATHEKGAVEAVPGNFCIKCSVHAHRTTHHAVISRDIKLFFLFIETSIERANLQITFY